MKTKLFALIVALLCSPIGQALACDVCYGGAGSGGAGKTGQSMAIAIWFLMAALMGVLGGFGGFGFYLWRHSRTPLEPHQELAEEDLNKYA